MDEKSRSTPSVCEALTNRLEKDSGAREKAAGGSGGATDDTVRAGCLGAAQRRSSNEFSSRVRTGLVSTCVTPFRNASSSQSDWLAVV